MLPRASCVSRWCAGGEQLAAIAAGAATMPPNRPQHSAHGAISPVPHPLLMWDAGTLLTQAYVHLSAVLARLCTFQAFSGHAHQLLQDEALCSGLLQLLLPGVPALAVGLQLPPERCPPECTWHAAAHLAAVVLSPPPSSFEQVLATDPEAARRLLSAATQLLHHCPFPAPSARLLELGGDGIETTQYFIWQLGDLVAFPFRHITGPLQQAGLGVVPETAAVAATAIAGTLLHPRLLRQLMDVLPRIGEALAAVAQAPGANLRRSAKFVAAASAVLLLMAHAATPQASGNRPAAAMQSVKELPSWARAAAAALRWLPAMVVVAERPQREQSAHQDLRWHCVELSTIALHLAMYGGQSLYAGVRMPDPAWSARSPAVQAECLTTLWELHTAVCRLVHSVLVGAVPQALIQQAVPNTVGLFLLMKLPCLIASYMSLDRDGIQEPPPDVARWACVCWCDRAAKLVCQVRGGV